MAVSKVVYGSQTLMDLTADTVDAESLLVGRTAHGADGELIEGACAFDVDSSEATAKASEILSGRTAGVKGALVTGAMPNNSAKTLKITEKAQQVPIPQGYHDGSGKAEIDSAEQAKLIPGNIRQGITVLGVLGTMSGTEGAIPQAKTVTPSLTANVTVLPDEGYNYLSQVTVNKVPYVESTNSAGGTTVTIG